MFPHSVRLHSWWLEDRAAHKLWRLSVERLADYRSWETADENTPEQSGPSGLSSRHVPLPTPSTLTESYERGASFETIRELYRSILRNSNLGARR